MVRLYQAFSKGELVLAGVEGRSEAQTLSRRIAVNLVKFPVTMALIALSVLLFPVAYSSSGYPPSGLFGAMTFVPFTVMDNAVMFLPMQEIWARGEFWRLLTPMFLHFSWAHTIFNLLWMFEIGRRIELLNGSSTILLVVLVSSLSANTFQYVMFGAGLFGGMSGVVYGVLGYCFL